MAGQLSGTNFKGPGSMPEGGEDGTGSTDIPANPSGPFNPTAGVTVPQAAGPSNFPVGSLSQGLGPSAGSPSGIPAVDQAHKSLLGKVTGDIFRGVAGGHYEDSVDPQTGKTTQTFVKAAPGEWARN